MMWCIQLALAVFTFSSQAWATDLKRAVIGRWATVGCGVKHSTLISHPYFILNVCILPIISNSLKCTFCTLTCFLAFFFPWLPLLEAWHSVWPELLRTQDVYRTTGLKRAIENWARYKVAMAFIDFYFICFVRFYFISLIHETTSRGFTLFFHLAAM